MIQLPDELLFLTVARHAPDVTGLNDLNNDRNFFAYRCNIFAFLLVSVSVTMLKKTLFECAAAGLRYPHNDSLFSRRVL